MSKIMLHLRRRSEGIRRHSLRHHKKVWKWKFMLIFILLQLSEMNGLTGRTSIMSCMYFELSTTIQPGENNFSLIHVDNTLMTANSRRFPKIIKEPKSNLFKKKFLGAGVHLEKQIFCLSDIKETAFFPFWILDIATKGAFYNFDPSIHPSKQTITCS